jgi:hypothetical protein
MRYEFKNATTGAMCCRADNPEYLCTSCAAQLRAAPPNPYAPAMRDLAAPDLGPNYEPHGEPPDGYRLALERRKTA